MRPLNLKRCNAGAKIGRDRADRPSRFNRDRTYKYLFIRVLIGAGGCVLDSFDFNVG